MKEELYIITASTRTRVDIASDSGITLEFKSNLFGSLSDIVCSHSYSFTLPFTANNTRVLDIADDIRHDSQALHKKLSCEYLINGIPVITDGNLYIKSITDNGYECVMTWNVCTALQDLLDDDCNLNELPNAYADTNTGYVTLKEFRVITNKSVYGFPTTINNNARYLQPNYPASGFFKSNTLPPKDEPQLGVPVVPVRHIMELISQKYGISINLGNSYTNEAGITTTNKELLTATQYNQGIATYGKDFAVSFGAIPLATRNITERQAELDCVNVRGTFTANHKILGIKNAVLLTSSVFNSNNQFKVMYVKDNSTGYGASGEIRDTSANGYLKMGIGFAGDAECAMRISGKVTAKFAEKVNGCSFKVYSWGTHEENGIATYGTHEEASIDIEESGNAGREFTFNFDSSEGYDDISIERKVGNDWVRGIFFAFSDKITSYTLNFDVYPKTTERETENYIDVVSNLPEVSVGDFMEFLFRGIGAFPVTRDGALYPIYYTDIEDNLNAGNTLDWSNKVTGSLQARPESVELAVDGYAQHNYFLMSTDDREKSDAERLKEDDVYCKGYGNISIADVTLENANDTYSAPFASAYEKNNNAPRIPTGNNIKAWEYDFKERKNTRCDVEPTYGILAKGDEDYTTFQVFMPFAMGDNMGQTESFRFMQSILAKPYIITEDLVLDEMELANIDYAKPIYLAKYSAYFAIISISRGSDGICETKLLKL